MASWGAAVDRLAVFDAAAMEALKGSKETIPDLHGGVALYFNCPAKEPHNHDDQATLIYRELPGVTIMSPQPDVFILRSELAGDITEEFTNLEEAVSFFTGKIHEASLALPSDLEDLMKAVKEALSELLQRDDKHPEQN